MKFSIYILFYFVTSLCLSQQQSKQNFNWMFGATPVGPNVVQTPGPSLNFSDCSVSVENNSAGFQFEGQTAISDPSTGNLLFYSNGNQVRNSLGQIMQNGNLVGTSNSMAQNLIVKKPGAGSFYYLFTPETQAGIFINTIVTGLNGFSYSLIDMSQNGGLGSVVSSANLLMPLGNCEMVTGVYHQNGEDIWIIGHRYNSNTFFSFLINSQGINSTPVLSSVGPDLITFQPGPYSISNYDAVGELKASPNGNKLAFTTFYNGYTCLFDFNKSTGVVSNPIQLNLGSAGYGTSFSSDNSKLYFSRVDATQGGISFLSNGSLVQFDISSNSQATIQASMTEIFSSPTGFRSLKLGPDGKIYVARTTLINGGNGASYLGVINDPNAAGLACNYVNDGVFIGANKGRWGLNNSIEDFYLCNEFQFTLGPDISICPDSSVLITAPPNQLSYLWNTGDTVSSISVSQPGTYWVEVESEFGIESDTIVVSDFVVTDVTIEGITSICSDSSTSLSASSGFTNYQWNNGSQTQAVSVGQGTWWVSALDGNGCPSSDTLSVFEFPSTNLAISGEEFICFGESATLVASTDFNTYQWSNGSESNEITVGAGIYELIVTDDFGCQSLDSFTVQLSIPVVTISGDEFICLGESTTLTASTGFNTYQWSNGSTSNEISVGAGTYELIVTDSLGCESVETFTVQLSIPFVDISGEETICLGESTTLTATTGFTAYQWTNGSASNEITVGAGTYELIVTDSIGCQTVESFTVQFSIPIVEILGNEFICTGELTTLTANAGFESYQWSNGSTSDEITVGAGTYELIVTDSLGCQTVENFTITSVSPTAFFTAENPIMNEDNSMNSFFNESENATSYLWDFGDGSAPVSSVNPSYVFSPVYGNTYNVTLTAMNELGCTDSYTMTFTIQDNLVYFVPNTFTPDGDQFNQTFKPIFTSGFDPFDYNLKIFNRWGELIFESMNHEVGWDGTYNATKETCLDGIYVWTIEFKTTSTDARKKIQGHVTLMK